MIILYNLVEMVATFLEGFIIAEFFRDIFSKSKGKEYLKNNIWFALAYMSCIRMLNMFEIFSYLTILTAAIFVSIYAVVVYEKKVIEAISVSSFYMMCLHVNGIICLAVVSVFGNDGELYEAVLYQNGIERLLYIVVGQAIWIMLCILVKHAFRKTRVQYKFGYRSIALITMGTVGIVYLTNQTLASFNIELTYAWMFVIAIIVLIIFNVYARTMDKENKARLQMTEMRNSLLEEKFQSIKDIYTNNAKTYHDLNNHLNVLNNLLEEGYVESAKKYIAEIREPIRKLSNTIWTGNEIVDTVINFVIDKMNSKNIAYDMNVSLLKDVNINAYDMGVLIGNLLDNAMEATEKLGESGRVHFTMKQIHQFISIKVTNPCDENLTFSGAYPETTKTEKELHGWGLKNVSDIVEKYDGSFKCLNNKGIFEVNVLLMNNDD